MKSRSVTMSLCEQDTMSEECRWVVGLFTNELTRERVLRLRRKRVALVGRIIRRQQTYLLYLDSMSAERRMPYLRF